MDDGVDRDDRPQWWTPEHDDFLDRFFDVESPLDVVALLDPPDGAFENAELLTDLWLAEAAARVEGHERVLYQHQFEKFTLALMAYADTCMVYAPALWELYLATTNEGVAVDEFGEPEDMPAAEIDQAVAKKLLGAARGECTRILMASSAEWELAEDERTEPGGEDEQFANAVRKQPKRQLIQAGRKRGRRPSQRVAERREKVRHMFEQVTKTPRVIAEKLRPEYPGLKTQNVNDDLKHLGLKG